jgi:hypothetical protein
MSEEKANEAADEVRENKGTATDSGDFDADKAGAARQARRMLLLSSGRCCKISLTSTQAKLAPSAMSAQALYPTVHMPKLAGIEARYTK